MLLLLSFSNTGLPKINYTSKTKLYDVNMRIMKLLLEKSFSHSLENSCRKTKFVCSQWSNQYEMIYFSNSCCMTEKMNKKNCFQHLGMCKTKSTEINITIMIDESFIYQHQLGFWRPGNRFEKVRLCRKLPFHSHQWYI